MGHQNLRKVNHHTSSTHGPSSMAILKDHRVPLSTSINLLCWAFLRRISSALLLIPTMETCVQRKPKNRSKNSLFWIQGIKKSRIYKAWSENRMPQKIDWLIISFPRINISGYPPCSDMPEKGNFICFSAIACA